MAYKTLDKQTVIKTWLWRGFHHFYFAFDIDDGNWNTYGPYFDSLGLEVFSKAYFLAERSSEYAGLAFQPAKERIDRIARSYNHELKDILNELNLAIGDNKIDALLKAKFDTYLGSEICEVLMAAKNEIRYPVPQPISEKFKIQGTNLAWYPLASSSLSKFAYSVCREILFSLKGKYNLGLCANDMEYSALKHTEGPGWRFCNLFFADERQKYLIS